MNFDPGSFRDRSSRVFYHHGDVYRALTAQSQAVWQKISREPFLQRMIREGKIVGTEEVSVDDLNAVEPPHGFSAVLRHERVPFITHPYEWSFTMLRRAALLHLEILTNAIACGFILKDATPYNVQFIGTKPTFIDLGSFVELTPGEPWLAYRQFCELMLFPLLLQAYRGVDFQPMLRANLEGISARQFMKWMRWRDLVRPGVFTNGWLQEVLERKAQAESTSTLRELQSSGFQSGMIVRMLKSLTRLVEWLSWIPERTQWTSYDDSLPQVAEDRRAKSDFVRAVCDSHHRDLVWDLGCNDGRYSTIAAERATTVIAMDQDHACIEQLSQSTTAFPGKIVPLCVGLANASPAQGWRGRERQRLEDRGRPDLVLCLGLIHHLVIASNIPLPEVVGWLASLGGEIVLEFPSKNDAMVRALLRNKRDQYEDYSLANLEAELQQHFTIRRQEPLPSGERTLFHATPKVLSTGKP